MGRIEIAGCPTHLEDRPTYKDCDEEDMRSVVCIRCGWRRRMEFYCGPTIQYENDIRWHEDHCPSIKGDEKWCEPPKREVGEVDEVYTLQV